MTILEQMLQNYQINTIEDKKNAMKEIMQEIILAALSKTDFFRHAAFYGGTALRLFYGLNRFSEDLDFTLLNPDESFSFEKYIPAIYQTVESMGLKFEITSKDKIIDTNIKSAFLKGNSRERFMIFYPDSIHSNLITHNEKIKIKFEIDVLPPPFARTELKYRLLPFPYQIRIYDKPSLFAGKIHAVIARGWNNRVKGRDLYDYVFYLQNKTPVNLSHLEARLKQSGLLKADDQLTSTIAIEMLNHRFNILNYKEAVNDVIPFVGDISSLALWSSDFFVSITKDLHFE